VLIYAFYADNYGVKNSTRADCLPNRAPKRPDWRLNLAPNLPESLPTRKVDSLPLRSENRAGALPACRTTLRSCASRYLHYH
jgi:hypothetical protein